MKLTVFISDFSITETYSGIQWSNAFKEQEEYLFKLGILDPAIF
jgi:hypothetical protein